MTTGRYEVRFSASAEHEVDPLTDFLLERARSIDELDQVAASIRVLRQAVENQLSTMPWSFRKARPGGRTTRRELVVPAGASGYVALYEIESMSRVLVLAVRHQLEQDYH